mmetsp:Transcript_155111/g.297650  ORF Transcript_155111/g.297650 Transcript_155111/m.297650 type:complete len:110 (-) Transcript_155111:244-573(-)
MHRQSPSMRSHSQKARQKPARNAPEADGRELATVHNQDMPEASREGRKKDGLRQQRGDIEVPVGQNCGQGFSGFCSEEEHFDTTWWRPPCRRDEWVVPRCLVRHAIKFV